MQKPVARILRRHLIYVRRAKILTETFVVDEEEGLILLDGTSHRSAKLVAMKRWNGPVEVISRVETFVAQKPKGTSVNLVRSRSGDRVDNPAGTPAVLGRRIACHHRKFCNCIHAQSHAQRTARRTARVIHDADPVDAIVIQLWPCAGDRQLLPISAASQAVAHIGLLS